MVEILLVDNEPDERRVIKRILEKCLEEAALEGLTITEIENGQAAITRINNDTQKEIALVITDYHMNPMNGDKVVIAAANMGKNVIMVSGKIDEIDEEIADECLGVYTKAVKMPEFVAMVVQALRKFLGKLPAGPPPQS